MYTQNLWMSLAIVFLVQSTLIALADAIEVCIAPPPVTNSNLEAVADGQYLVSLNDTTWDKKTLKARFLNGNSQVHAKVRQHAVER